MPKLAHRPDLSDALLAVAHQQHGALTTAQLGGHDLGDSHVRSLHRTGILTSPHRGIHVVTSLDRGLVTRAMAARLTTSQPAHACLETAATLLGWLDEWAPDPVRLVMDPRTKTRQALTGVDRHWHAVDPGDVLRLRDLTLTGPATTVRELARHRSMIRMVAIMDSALHRGRVDPGIVSAVAAALPPGKALWHPLLDRRSESPLESETRVIMVLDGLRPEPQHTVSVAGRTYRLDLPFPRWKVTVECNGDGFHGAPEPIHKDRIRLSDLEHAGWTVVFSTWRDLNHDPAGLLRRIHRALADQGCLSSR